MPSPALEHTRPPRAPEEVREHSRPRRWATWSASTALTAAVLGAVLWSERPPAPRPATAPATAFSEERARPVLEHLVGNIGLRVIGTEGRDAALAYLEATLQGIPGLEIEHQDWRGLTPNPWREGAFTLHHARNLLVRVPGDSASAVLVSAHYDSPPESVGAGDAGVAVAAAVETIRALAAGERLRHSVIVNFNDGEEAGLLGAMAFTRHPWVREVRAFVNLESAGPQGKAVLFQAGPGNPWLTHAYAAAAAHPYGSVIAQDLFQSGLIPSDTDFRIYRDYAGLRGLDLALYRDGYAYHTDRDRVERVERGSIQHMGANTLALARHLASGDLPGEVSERRAIYYDFLGLRMFSYDQATATALAVGALLLLLGALALAMVRGALPGRALLAGFGITLAAAVLSRVAVALLALVPPYLLGRPHGWFASPWLGVVAYGGLALAGFLFVHALWERRSIRRGLAAEVRSVAALAGALLYFAVLLVLLTAAGLGLAYLALWWVAPGALGLMLYLLRPRWWGAALALAFLPGALLATQVGVTLLGLFAPVAGRFPAPLPFDPIIALLIALPVVDLGVMGAAALHRAGGLGRLAAGSAAVGLAGLLAVTLAFPYSAERPKRLVVTHTATDTTATLTVRGWDWVDTGLALRGVAGADAFRRSADSRLTLERPAPAPELPALPLQLGEAPGAEGLRRIDLRLGRGEYHNVSFRIPAARLASWSFAEPLPPLAPGEVYVLRVLPPPAEGWEFSLDVRGAEPLEVEVIESYMPRVTPTARALLEQLPEWVATFTTATRRQRLPL